MRDGWTHEQEVAHAAPALYIYICPGSIPYTHSLSLLTFVSLPVFGFAV